MPKSDHPNADQPLRETEQAAYHAYREWPILLVLRLKELAALKAAPPEKTEEKRS